MKGSDLANEYKEKHGATISEWKSQGKTVHYEIKNGHKGSVIVPVGEMRPSMARFVFNVLKIIFTCLLLLGAYAWAIR